MLWLINKNLVELEMIIYIREVLASIVASIFGSLKVLGDQDWVLKPFLVSFPGSRKSLKITLSIACISNPVSGSSLNFFSYKFIKFSTSRLKTNHLRYIAFYKLHCIFT